MHKKHKNWKSYTPGSGDAGTDFPYVHYSTGTIPSMLFGKRPASSNVGSVPTKRMRTATRHRVVSPFTVTTGTIQAQDRADASSGDNNSFHDDHIDQSTLHVGPLIQKSMEVESVTDFEKQLAYDCAETSIKTKKKKKAMTLVIFNLYLYNCKHAYFLRCVGIFYSISEYVIFLYLFTNYIYRVLPMNRDGSWILVFKMNR